MSDATREKNRVRAREYIQRKRAADPKQIALRAFYDELVAERGEVCEICGSPPEPDRRLCIDHDHETDEVRGLLCRQCNLLLGYAKESVDILRSAIAFLSRDAYTSRRFAEVTAARTATVTVSRVP